MSIQVGVDILVDDRDLLTLLERLDTVFSYEGLAEFMIEKVEPYLSTRAQNRFTAEGDDVTGRWAPLAESTQRIRESQGFGPAHPINKRTGELERAIVGAEAAVIDIAGGAEMTWPGQLEGDNYIEEKLSTAQKGKSFPSTQPRPVLGINEADTTYVTTELASLLGITG